MAETTNEHNRVDYVRPELKAALPDLDLMADLLAGTRTMHAKAKTYIHKWKDEDDSVFKIRSTCEEVFEGLGRTLNAGVGMLFAREPNLEWNSATAAEDHWDNIDAQGTKGHVFAKRFSEQSIRDGLGLILVDHPPKPEDVVVHAGNEEELNLRPTWAFYPRRSARSWRYATIDNQTTLTQLVLDEPAIEEFGAYGIRVCERYRVLRLQQTKNPARPDEPATWSASWEIWEKTEDTNSQDPFKRVEGPFFFTNKKGEVAKRLPVAIAYTGRSDAPMTATVPLLGVAWANLGHYRIASNLRFYADLLCFPQPTVLGQLAQETNAAGQVQQPRLRLGPLVVVHLQGEGAAFTYTSPDPGGFEPPEKLKLEKEQAMGKLGMSFLITDTRAAETATAKRLDATAENSTLATCAQGIDDAVNEAFRWHAWYLGVENDGAPTFELNKDFDSTTLDPQTMAVYVSAVQQAGFPIRILLEAWQKGGRIPADVDLDELEAEMLANAEAIAQQKAEEMEAMKEKEGGSGTPGADDEEDLDEEEA